MRKILIEGCSECPFIRYQGGFGPIAYIPYCKKAGKVLPYKEEISKNARAPRIVAVLDAGIPGWCPLDDAE